MEDPRTGLNTIAEALGRASQFAAADNEDPSAAANWRRAVNDALHAMAKELEKLQAHNARLEDEANTRQIALKSIEHQFNAEREVMSALIDLSGELLSNRPTLRSKTRTYLFGRIAELGQEGQITRQAGFADLLYYMLGD